MSILRLWLAWFLDLGSLTHQTAIHEGYAGPVSKKLPVDLAPNLGLPQHLQQRPGDRHVDINAVDVAADGVAGRGSDQFVAEFVE